MFINKTIILFFIITILYFTNNVSSNETKEQDICLLDKEIGMCRAGFVAYYFDKTKKDCVKFLFGGCDGNANNFNTYKECVDRCKDHM